MARKRRKQIPSSFLKMAGFAGLILLLGFGVSLGLAHLLRQSDYFKIKSVKVDESLSFLSEYDLARLRGENIFEVDLRDLQKRLSSKYPQIAHLKVSKRYPNQLILEARKRVPFAQARLKNRTLILDGEGVVLSMTGSEEEHLPFISGLKPDSPFDLGFPLKGREVETALKILKAFDSEEGLSAYRIVQLNVENLSDIQLFLSNNLKVILDRYQISDKTRLLSLFLSRNDLDFSQVRYIDMRFKEPVVGRR